MIKTGSRNQLDKLEQLTTNWGIYQHGKLDKPNPEFGYALEDQARALIVTEAFGEEKLANIYFEFIINALDNNGKIYQYFYDSDDSIVPDRSKECSEDGLGIVTWALMTTKKEGQKKDKILKIILNQAEGWNYLRPMVYLVLGLVNGNRSDLEDSLTKKILDAYKEDGDWRWSEDKLTYGNALIPWALWKRGRIRQDRISLEIAPKATDFLLKMNLKDNVPMPVANFGLNKDDRERIYFDQQPIEVAYMVCCLEQAYLTTNDRYYWDQASNWWKWFWGNNINQAKLIDNNFACYDGLTANDDKVNLNQGAESNICFLMAYQAVKRLNLVD
ncbi:hypothetical protein COY20_01565 [Candidatus Shapirobacteria bacterium CG_4_10_14_0_2_um_filter_40_12]|uniref:Glycosyltransferase n=1 Tax=Candidatus Shapirobacteria bacterium CG_4_10_14_0_2_um_filter_40_12 TaxID=1974871 RepID=A0A2M7TTJ6_9BACT|nr:MAG: hypothetical protein COY20_01565 [Candidatus Shapirobacteria bacterium CG_4_10_14_0_2_um_filter_40_12]